MGDSMVISAKHIVTRDGIRDDAALTVRDGRIEQISTDERQRPEVDGHWVVPGFVDIHCHGGGGDAFTDRDQQRAASAATAHLRHGTTTMLASLVTRPIPELAEQITALSDLVRDGVFAGIHLEGPFLSAARCGAHDPALLRAPDADSVRTLLDAAGGTIGMVTLAPELDGAVAAVRTLVDAGVIAALGHTDAVEAAVLPAVDAGATVATHLFNGMRPLHHREPGPVGALLDDERVAVELICDLVHLHPTAVRLAARHAGTGRTVLITDAIAATGMGDGEYDLGGLKVTVRDGVPTLDGGGALAGSTLTMDDAFRNFVHSCGMTVAEAVAATSTKPAQLLGLGEKIGALDKGYAADLVVLDEDLRLVRVMRGGTWVD